MANIKPLRAWRYGDSLAARINDLTSPLFDVVSSKQRQKLYQQPLNSIHLSVPISADAAAETLARWKNENIIIQDEKPAIYVYYQYFSLPDSKEDYCRKGFICNIEATAWDENIVLRHENTIPNAVSDRLELLEKTLLNVSPTHGLYADESRSLEPFMDAAIKNPILESEDYQGVRDVLAKIDDPQIIDIFVATIAHKNIILADGHHRYEGSVAFRQAQKQQNKAHNGTEAYNFHLMYLTEASTGGLRILPTHRLLVDLPDFDENRLIEQLPNYFIVTEIDNPFEVNEIILGKKHAFGVITKNKAFKIRLKPNILETITWHFPPAVQTLDLTVLHYFIFKKVIGIKGTDQRSSPNIRFERNFTECIAEVSDGRAQVAFIVNPVVISQVQEVCLSGATLPQKSTYFYPKVICGFVFSSIDEKEWKSQKF